MRNYLKGAFALMLSETTWKMGIDLRPYESPNNILAAAWSFFAKGLNKEGRGSIGVCKRCGNFYEAERATRVYCSDSCRVSALHDPKIHERAAGYVTETVKLRKQIAKNGW